MTSSDGVSSRSLLVFVLMAQFVLVNVVVAVLMKVICDREEDDEESSNVEDTLFGRF